MRILDDVPFEIDAGDVFSRLHLDTQSQYAGEINAMIEQARQLARPRAVYEVAFVQEREDESVVLGEATRELEQALGRPQLLLDTDAARAVAALSGVSRSGGAAPR